MSAGFAEPGGRFARYEGEQVELVGYTTCGGCPGGNVEYTGEEMVQNGAQVIHLATGLLVGYPPCPYIDTFKSFLVKRYGVDVVPGMHPIPKKYLDLHASLGTWDDPKWRTLLGPAMTNGVTREAYDQEASDEICLRSCPLPSHASG